MLCISALAQVAGKSVVPLWIMLGVLIVVVVAMGIAMLVIRRRLLEKEGAAGQEGLMAGLREMRNRGEISPEEYDAARRTMAARAAGVAPAQAGVKRQPEPGAAGPGGGARVAKPGFDLTGAPLPKPPKPGDR